MTVAPIRPGSAPAAGYAHVEELLAADRCVMLDGGTGTELARLVPAARRADDEAPWGTWSLVHAPDLVKRVHRSYVDTGCDVISTNTWGLAGEMQERSPAGLGVPVHWMDVARRGIRAAARRSRREGAKVTPRSPSASTGTSRTRRG